MKAISVAVALLSAAGALAQSSTLTINTPIAPVVCEPLLITWSGGTPPYFLYQLYLSMNSLLPGNQPSAAAIIDFGQQSGNSITWVVNQTVGTSLGLDLRDSTGALAQSAPFTIQSGPSTSCLTSSGGSSASGASSAAGSTPAGASTPATSPATTPANTATTPGNTPTSPATTPAGASTSKSASSSGSAPATSNTAKSGALSVQAAGGFVTAMGAALVALIVA